ncbi:MAG: peptidoglycan-associated lipoprotein Pal [Halobacteriovoraceae bacterium]|nr:peptidoglycan-associated lipoprotein Pal [Halobacteriovoraceae bacterium]MCB9095907.1 peptidoglycan-associated lipoprotein Pal [Halobacteriovoraceae bacterium]
MKKVLSVLFLSTVLIMAGCSSSKKKDRGDGLDSEGGELSDQGLSLELNGSSDNMTAGAISTVYFAFDSATISDAARATLDANSEYLKSNSDVQVQIEGHCDERGSVQYNLALGERRANAVRDYLVAMGVDSARITTISYGKERPIDLGHDEAAWARNRRGNFVITAK